MMLIRQAHCLGFLFAAWTTMCPSAWSDDPTAASEIQVAGARRLGSARFLNIGRVFALAYSPDGKLLAGGGWDGSIRIWEADTGKERLHWDGHKGAVQKLAFSGDGKWLVSTGTNPGIALWEVATGRLKQRLDAGTATGNKKFTDVAFAPDGKSIAAIGGGTLYLWDQAGREVWRQGGDRIHTRLAFQGSDRLATLYTKSFALRQDQVTIDFGVWSCASGKELDSKTMDQNRFGWPDAITLSGDGRLLSLPKIIKFGQEEEIKFVRTQRGRPIPAIQLVSQHASVLCFSPDQRMLAVTGDSWGPQEDREAKFIRVFEVITGLERCRFRSPDPGKLSLAFSPDGRTLASGSLDITVMLWDLTGSPSKEKRIIRNEDLNKLWEDLKSSEARVAYGAHWKLIAAGKQSVAFLAKHLRPAPTPDPKRLAPLIRDLADKRFQIRQRASAELRKMGDRAEAALLEVLRSSPDLELRRRTEHLLEQIHQPSPERSRLYRAVEVLERIGTSEADTLLRHLAAGRPGALLTQAAEEAHRRLEHETRLKSARGSAFPLQ